MTNDNSEQPRKGRSNAIMTYETISSVERELIQVSTKLDHMIEKVEDMKTLHVDHEVRIKALELSQASTLSASSASSASWTYMVTLAIAIPGSITAIISILRFMGVGA